jgi:hypothetical protein
MTSFDMNCLLLPQWVNDLLVNFGGLRKFDNISVDDLTEKYVDSLVVYEDDYVDNKDQLVEALRNGRLKTLVIFNTHPYLFGHDALQELDRLSKKFDIHILVEGSYATDYPNIRLHHFGLNEHFISHHFNLLLANRLASRRQVQTPFLVQIIGKDKFRRKLLDTLTTSSVKDAIRMPTGQSSEELYKNKQELFDLIKDEYKINNGIYQALDSFGNGLPNLQLYEKCHCEIVAETQNISGRPWLLTEKTWRPFAFGIPVVFLGSREMFDTIKSYGYDLFDNGFYNKWHDQSVPYEERLQALVQFMKYIMQSDDAKQKLDQSAEHNKQVFWNQRKMQYYKNWNDIFDKICSGKEVYRTVDDVYKRLDF